jgi:RNA polymerase sigma-70 factor, ECF subfamily
VAGDALRHLRELDGGAEGGDAVLRGRAPRCHRSYEPESGIPALRPARPRYPRSVARKSKHGRGPAPAWEAGFAERVDALLARRRAGDEGAQNELLALVYDLVRAMARRAMRGQPASHTLQPTAVANEAYLKVARSKGDWENEAHLRAVLAKAVRWVLVDHARNKQRGRRSAPGHRVDVDWLSLGYAPRSEDLVALDEALEELAAGRSRAAQVVELRYFGDLSMPEIARLLEVTVRTVERDWAFARGWLRARLS